MRLGILVLLFLGVIDPLNQEMESFEVYPTDSDKFLGDMLLAEHDVGDLGVLPVLEAVGAVDHIAGLHVTPSRKKLLEGEIDQRSRHQSDEDALVAQVELFVLEAEALQEWLND